MRYGISQTLKTAQQRWEVIRIILFLAALIMTYWEFNRWIPALWKKEDASRVDVTTDQPVPPDLPPPGAINASSSTEGGTPPTDPGTDVVEATRPSTGEGIPGLETIDGSYDEDEENSPRQRCQADEIAITGCARKHLAGMTCRDAVVGKVTISC